MNLQVEKGYLNKVSVTTAKDASRQNPNLEIPIISIEESAVTIHRWTKLFPHNLIETILIPNLIIS